MSSQVPADLRALSASGLRVVVSVDNDRNVYEAVADKGGKWEVPVDFEPNVTYKLNIKWFVGDVLVLEEITSVFADPSIRSIKVEPGIFITSGYPRFDDDCDGVSNYFELKTGTAPGPVVQFPSEICTNSKDSDNAVLYPPRDIRSHFPNAFSINPKLTTRVELPIYVQTLNPHKYNTVSLDVSSQDWDVDQTYNFSVALVYEPGFEKTVEFTMNTLNHEATVENNRPCHQSENESFFCRVPYEWKERHWYVLSLYQVGTESWQAALLDSSTKEEIKVGTVSFPSAHLVKLSYITAQLRQRIVTRTIVLVPPLQRSRSTEEECADGIQPSAIQMKSPTINNSYMINAVMNTVPPSDNSRASLVDLRLGIGECLTTGGGWSVGTRTYNGETVHSMVVGQYDK